MLVCCRCGGRTNRIEHWRRRRRRRQLIEAAGPTHKCPGEAKLCAHKILQNYTQYRDTTSHRRCRSPPPPPLQFIVLVFFYCVLCVECFVSTRRTRATRAHTHVSNTHTGLRSERVSHTHSPPPARNTHTHTVYIYAYNLCTTSRELVGTARESVSLTVFVSFLWFML